jgi:cytochrome c553
MRQQILAIALALGVVLIAAAWSQEKAPQTGNTEAGRTVAVSCAVCHGMNGISSHPGTPHLAGQHAEYIKAAVMAYKNNARKDQQMQEAVRPLNEQNAVDLAAYYASLTGFNSRPKASGPKPTTAAEPEGSKVKQKAALCSGCHGEDGNVHVAGMPSLAGQHSSYLITAIASYQEGSRAAPMMQALVKPLNQTDIEAIADFYAALEPRRTDTAAAGDPKRGAAVTVPCASCHGEDGNSTDPKTPRLAGLDALYLETSIKAYKDGTRKHDPMRLQTSGLGEQDIRDIGAFYASKEPKVLPVPKVLTLADWTERCSRCHGPDGNSSDPRFPVLAGQDETYLAKAMALYHGGERSNSLMSAMLFPMTESDIKQLAAYYAQQRSQ